MSTPNAFPNAVILKERIEREWWLEEGDHRDYYNVEDEEGQRYWLFRSGHYEGGLGNQWFLHGVFA